MTDKELIQQLKTLKNIKPNKDWAVFLKQEITENKDFCLETHCAEQSKVLPVRTFLSEISEFLSNIGSSALFKPSFAVIACCGLFLSVFGFAQSALPGDLFYPAKKITEKIEINLAGAQEKPNVQIAMTNKKIKELNQVVQANLGKNLAPAIQEVEQSAQETAKTIEKLTESVKIAKETAKKDHQDIARNNNNLEGIGQQQDSQNSRDSNEQIDEQISSPEQRAEQAEQARQIEQNKDKETAFVKIDTEQIKQTLASIQEINTIKQEVETMGVIVETPELDKAIDDCYKTLAEVEIEAMENQTLTEEQEALLSEIQELMTQEQFQQAFEKLLLGQ